MLRMLRRSAVLAVMMIGLPASLCAEDPAGPAGDKPAGPQSLPGDKLPRFNMLGPDGRLVPMPHFDGPVHPDAGGAPPPVPGPDMETALTMARAAIAACAAKGAHVGATVVDSKGEARAMLTGDGADGSFVFVAQRKALTALTFGTTSLEANRRVWSGAEPMSRVTPQMFVMGGAVPIYRDGDLIGAVGVSGAAGPPPYGSEDESCAMAGLAAGGFLLPARAGDHQK